MFSCCRSNPNKTKSTKKDKNKSSELNDEAKDGTEKPSPLDPTKDAPGLIDSSQKDSSTTQQPQQPQHIIPTITVENGKSSESSNNGSVDSLTDINNGITGTDNGIGNGDGDGNNDLNTKDKNIDDGNTIGADGDLIIDTQTSEPVINTIDIANQNCSSTSDTTNTATTPPTSADKTEEHVGFLEDIKSKPIDAEAVAHPKDSQKFAIDEDIHDDGDDNDNDKDEKNVLQEDLSIVNIKDNLNDDSNDHGPNDEDDNDNEDDNDDDEDDDDDLNNKSVETLKPLETIDESHINTIKEQMEPTTTNDIVTIHQDNDNDILQITTNTTSTTTPTHDTINNDDNDIITPPSPIESTSMELAMEQDNALNEKIENVITTASPEKKFIADANGNDSERNTVNSIIKQNVNNTNDGNDNENTEDDEDIQDEATQLKSSDLEDIAKAINSHRQTDAPPKSCLSRHNSTHTSIKKKVNISSHAEIIEPEPLPPPPYDLTSPSLDDDEVFSDSLPPPKRESMCAPYIGRDIEGETTAVFAHGLPEWFNVERLHEIGCLEPPVTPVGRDELELKRQRLYADLLRAAQAAVEHSVRFAPFGTETIVCNVESARSTCDCDPDLKPSVAENLEHLVNRLEKLVERLERSVSARELEIANKTFDEVLEKKRESFDLESAALPPVPKANSIDSTSSKSSVSEQLTHQADQLNQRIEKIENCLNRINVRHNSQSASNSKTTSRSSSTAKEVENVSNSLENIPTVLADYQAESESGDRNEEELPPLPPPLNMSVYGFQDIIQGPLGQYLQLSAKIGGDVAKHAELVKKAFDAQMKYIMLASECAKPSQDKQMELLKPTSTQITAIQEYREKNRASPYFNHLSAISESIPALGWVCVSPTPGPHVKEMNDAGQFYTNRVLKEWKEKDTTHVEWARSWIQTLTELQIYIKQYHTTGLVWAGKCPVNVGGFGAPPPPPPIGACPPPPPPPAFDLAAMSLDGSADERSALFAEINQGEAITKNLKKVTADMQTHKNPTLRTGPAPFKKPTQFGGASPAPPAIKEPVFTRDGKKWIIEHQKKNAGLLVENAEMNNVVYMFKCDGSTLTVKGKVNNIVMDSCKKCSLLFDSVVASVEFVNCQSIQVQVLGNVPTISIDKTDGCQMYLSKDSMGVEIISSKSSEMNVMLPESSGDYVELALPEQFKTTISGKTLKTVCVDSLG